MPVQTTNKSYVYFPDGAKVAIKAAGDSEFTDLGAINSAVTATLNWTENTVTTANAGDLRTQIRAMNISGGFTLINLDPVGISKMSGGLFSVVNTAGTAVTTVPNQVIAAGWNDGVMYNLNLPTSSSDSTALRASAAPTFTSITIDAAGTPETLTAGNDYVVMADPNSPSGYSITFISSGMTTVSPKTKAITIDYNSVTPIASSTVYCGASTATLNSYAMQISHTDDNGDLRKLDLYSVNPNTGGFQFNYKGANEDGVEEMPLTFTARLDTSLTSGRQLMAWTVENGAA